LWTTRINAAAVPVRAEPISRWGEGPNRPGQKLWGQKIENSQSDGIAANHSRKRWQAAWVRTERVAGWRVTRRLDEVRGDERNAASKSDLDHGEARILF
jgi:hypothetical protein